MTEKLKSLVDRLEKERRLEPEEYAFLLAGFDDRLLEYINGRAAEVTKRVFGNGIYIRGLIEISNYCHNDCYYCGIRRSNLNVERYRLSKAEVLECCRLGNDLGFRTFVLQGGEDAGLSDKVIEEMITAIHAEFPGNAITLSLGERSSEAYRRFFEAGANRYLLRHETADKEHYRYLHPAGMSFDNRVRSLHDLKEIGFQTGTGMMIGSPGQTVGTLAEDVAFIEKLKPEMIGIGPYMPQCDTPFANEPAGSTDMTLLLISIFRLMFPAALIPATTALASAEPEGRGRGVLAGANVIMPNLSPESYRAKYAIYDNKNSFGLEAAEGLKELEKELNSIGYRISWDRGDFGDVNS